LLEDVSFAQASIEGGEKHSSKELVKLGIEGNEVALKIFEQSMTGFASKVAEIIDEIRPLTN
jgi:hypothetical protein